MSVITVRDATPDDVELLHTLVCELAEYEKLRDAVRATSDSMRAALFGSRPYCEALVGEIDGVPAGFALFFHNYSTFAGKPGIYGVIGKVAGVFMISPEKGAKTSIYLATSPEVEGVTGKYFDKCKPKIPNQQAQDDAAAQRLWVESEKLTGFTASF